MDFEAPKNNRVPTPTSYNSMVLFSEIFEISSSGEK